MQHNQTTGERQEYRLLGKCFLLACQECEYGRIELSATLEEVELHEEEISDKITAKLAHKASSSSSATTCKRQSHQYVGQVVRSRGDKVVPYQSQ